MNYIGLNKYDTANGPGIRVSLFVSGCTLCCKGCFNKESWKFNAGLSFTEQIKNEIIEELKNPWINGFSLLGGDPLEPKLHDDVLDLVKSIKQEVPNKDIWLWTGRLYENEKDNEILEYVDVLVDGPFMQDLYSSELLYRGSKNQRVINIYKKEFKMKFREFLHNKFNKSEYTVKPKDKDELLNIIEDTIKEKGNNCDLNFIDTSLITDMSELFKNSKFNGDISKWDVSKVENMANMFKDSPLEDKEPDWYK